MLTQNLGYPRIGAKRELKKNCENYWTGKISEEELKKAGKLERQKNWLTQKDAGIDLIPCNDFSFYDQVNDMTFMLGALPERFNPLRGELSETDLYFSMCRGYQKNGHDLIAMEMTKWFDTNYHYIVPEFVKNQAFSFSGRKIIDEFVEARQLGIATPKPVLIGPISYLLLGKEKEEGFNKLDLLDKLLPVYTEILSELEKQGCEYLQLDEPFLVTDLNDELRLKYRYAYDALSKASSNIKIVLTTYFGDLGENMKTAVDLPVHALHIDLVRGKKQLKKLLSLVPEKLNLSLGVVDGRNIWKNDFKESIIEIDAAIEVIGKERTWLAPSCSFLHCPYDLELETDEKSLPQQIKEWMAFAKQKLWEINTLKQLKSSKKELYDDAFTELIHNAKNIEGRKKSELVNNPEVQEKLKMVSMNEIKRDSEFEERLLKQNEKFDFPEFPTTTIGSFPQTKEVRKKRRDHKKGVISTEEYDNFLKEEIKNAVKWQEKVGIDVLVHGEFERNDMVEYFGELLDGFVFTENGWVQSYGSRGVKPPVIFGDVSRKEPMTLKWTKYAQSLTNKKMKGMLTGPVTILQWSFVRNDQPRKLTAFQIALALKDEVLDLEKAGIDIIQIDEPALREGLPIKKNNWQEYLHWAVQAFRICSLGVKDDTQIHTHMCYSEFNDIIESIAEMDADVISIETSRSQMELLEAFSDFKYPNQIGPGVYDIHSPRIPSVEEMEYLLRKARKYIPVSNLWVNPDCGLKTRNWEEVKAALVNMVKAAQNVKAELEEPVNK